MNLEDRIRTTLHAEAERFEPHLATTPLRPASQNRPWLAFAGAAAVVVAFVGVGVLLSRPEPPSDTPPPGSTQPLQTTVPTETTIDTPLPGGLVPWVPEYTVTGGSASVVLTMVDGSTAEISWPENLDLMSEGIYPNGYAFMPEAAHDFVIRHGRVEDVINMFGPATVLESYSDGRGGTVNLWRPEGAGTDYLGFQFDDWAVLVYEGGTQVETPPMGDATRQQWIESFHGEATDDGFLRLYADEPLRIAGVGTRLSMTMRSPGGTVELAVERCEPSEPSSPFAEFMTWCDESGWVTVFVSGAPEFMEAVRQGLDIGEVIPAGVSGAYLQDELAAADARWGETLESMEPNAPYRLSLTGHLGAQLVFAEAEVRAGMSSTTGESVWVKSVPPTVETLFGIIEEYIEQGDPISVLFHPDGYPERIDLIENGVRSSLWVSVEWLDEG